MSLVSKLQCRSLSLLFGDLDHVLEVLDALLQDQGHVLVVLAASSPLLESVTTVALEVVGRNRLVVVLHFEVLVVVRHIYSLRLG